MRKFKGNVPHFGKRLQKNILMREKKLSEEIKHDIIRQKMMKVGKSK